MSHSQSLRIRYMRKDELEAIVRLSARAFKGRPMTEALFPTHLQTDLTSPGEVISREEFDFRVGRHLHKFDDEALHYLVVVDDEDNPVGTAIWKSPLRTEPDKSKTVDALLGPTSRPKSMDMAVVAEIEKGLKVLERNLQDALGADGYRNSWYLDLLAVDPDYQRRGIGKMLMQWGQERADQEHTNVRLMSSEAGAQLYRAVGFEEVGSVDVYGGMEYAFIKRAV